LYIVGAVVYRYFCPLAGGLTVNPMLVGGAVTSSLVSSKAEALFAQEEVVMFSVVSRIIRGFLSVPIMMFAYDCQALVFQLYTSLEHSHRTVDAMVKVTTRAIVAAWAVFVVIGVFGYLTLGDATPDNILRAYNPKKDPVFAVAYAMFLVPATVAFALVLFPVRDVVFDALEAAGWPTPVTRFTNGQEEDNVSTSADEDAQGEEVEMRSPKSNNASSAIGDAEEGADAAGVQGDALLESTVDDQGDRTFRVVSGVLSLLCLATALVAPRLDVVFGLLGGLCSSCLCFLFPAAYRLRLAYEGIVPLTNVVTKRTAWGMVILGVFGALFGTAAGVLELVRQYYPNIV
jgi:amino acid permease